MTTHVSTNEEWESETLHWSKTAKPGYQYSKKKNAWWKHKNQLVVKYVDSLTYTSFCNVYKTRNKNFDETSLEIGEKVIYSVKIREYKGFIIIAFENGKVAKIAMKSYLTEYNRKKLVNAFNDESKLVFIRHFDNDIDLVAVSSNNKIMVFNTDQINCVDSKITKGVQVLKLKSGTTLLRIKRIDQVDMQVVDYYRMGLNSMGYYLQSHDTI